MAQSQVVYTDIRADAEVRGSLFEGLTFWIAQRTPLRNTYVETVRRNGGDVTPLEKRADILISDHMRNDSPLGALSYMWIERSVADGVLADKAEFPAARPARSVRPVGSGAPSKGVRHGFTREDDEVLYQWVIDCQNKRGKVLGNEIYKQLEKVNARHPWQSWRDRWIKFVSHRPPPTQATAPHTAPPTPPEDPPPRVEQESRTETAAPMHNTAHEARDVDGLVAEAPAKQLHSALAIQEPATESSTPNGNLSRAMHYVQMTSTGNYKVAPAHAATPRHTSFTQEDRDFLLFEAHKIMQIRPDREQEAWDDIAEFMPAHTATEWKSFFEREILPVARRSSHLSLERDSRSNVGSRAASAATTPTTRQPDDPRSQEEIGNAQQSKPTVVVTPSTKTRGSQEHAERKYSGQAPTSGPGHEEQIPHSSPIESISSRSPANNTRSSKRRKLSSPSVEARLSSTDAPSVSPSLHRQSHGQQILATAERRHHNHGNSMSKSKQVAATSAQTGDGDYDDDEKENRGTAMHKNDSGLLPGDVLDAFGPDKEEVYFRLESAYAPPDGAVSVSEHDPEPTAERPDDSSRLSSSFSQDHRASRAESQSPELGNGESALGDEERFETAKEAFYIAPSKSPSPSGGSVREVAKNDTQKNDPQTALSTTQEEEDGDEPIFVDPHPNTERLATQEQTDLERREEISSDSSEDDDSGFQIQEDPSDIWNDIPTVNVTEVDLSVVLPPEEEPIVEVLEDEASDRDLSAAIRRATNSGQDTQTLLSRAAQLPNLPFELPSSSQASSSAQHQLAAEEIDAPASPSRLSSRASSMSPVSARNYSRKRKRARAASSSSQVKEASREDIDAFIADQIARGHSEPVIIRALELTTYDSELSTQILLNRSRGLDIPYDTPGVWSEEQDRTLRGSDAPEMALLEDFHGVNRYRQRLRYLQWLEERGHSESESGDESEVESEDERQDDIEDESEEDED